MLKVPLLGHHTLQDVEEGWPEVEQDVDGAPRHLVMQCGKTIKDWAIGPGYNFSTACGALLMVEILDACCALVMIGYHHEYDDTTSLCCIFTISYCYQIAFSTYTSWQAVRVRDVWTQSEAVFDSAHDGYGMLSIKCLQFGSGFTPFFEVLCGFKSPFSSILASTVKNARQLSSMRIVARLRQADGQVDQVAAMSGSLQSFHIPVSLLLADLQSARSKLKKFFSLWVLRRAQVGRHRWLRSQALDNAVHIKTDDTDETDDTDTMPPPSADGSCGVPDTPKTSSSTGIKSPASAASCPCADQRDSLRDSCPICVCSYDHVERKAAAEHGTTSSPSGSGLTAWENAENVALAQEHDELSAVPDRSAIDHLSEALRSASSAAALCAPHELQNFQCLTFAIDFLGLALEAAQAPDAGGTDDTDADGSDARDSIYSDHFDWAAVCTASCNVDGGVCLSVERRCFPQWREGVCHSGEKVCFAHQHLGDVEIL